MKRITLWALSTVSAVALLFGYHTSTQGALGNGTGTDTVAAAGPTPGETAGETDASGETSSSTVTGEVIQTRWGPVQVEITVADGVITEVTVPQYPSGNHEDEEINNYALPILIEETLQAQSADIDMVSGATVTSGGYVDSLQSALDEAGL